ncbi:MAG: hypothetical protein DDT27_01471 [Dehalococcoidia bacterium]|nr:hypothetical protein [Chloroflexota bacterium]
MIWHQMFRPLEPEGGKLIEHQPLIRNADWQNDIKGRNAVGGHEKELIPTQVISVPHLAPIG